MYFPFIRIIHIQVQPRNAILQTNRTGQQNLILYDQSSRFLCRHPFYRRIYGLPEIMRRQIEFPVFYLIPYQLTNIAPKSSLGITSS